MKFWPTIYPKLFSIHMHQLLIYHKYRKNTYQSVQNPHFIHYFATESQSLSCHQRNRKKKSSLDSRPTIQTPFHSCSFVPLRCNLQPPQLFRYVPLPSSLLHTQQTNISRFHHIRQAPSFSRHRPNIQTAHSHAVTVHIPHKNDIYGDYIIIFSLKTKIEKKMIFIYLPGRLWIRSEPGQPDCLLRP